MSGAGEFLWRCYFRSKIDKWDNLDSANEVERGIDNQAVLGETDCDREIGNDAILRIDFAGIGVQTGGKIDRKNKSVVRVAQLINFASGCTDRFAKKSIGAKAKQTIEDNGVAWAAGPRSLGRMPMQRLQFLACQFAAFAFREGQVEVDLPSGALQMFRGDERISAVVALSGVNEARPGVGKKFTDYSRYARASLIHQRFNFDPARESGFFRVSHLRRI